MKKPNSKIIVIDTKKINLNSTFEEKKLEQMDLNDLQYILKFEAKSPNEIKFIKNLIKLKTK
ncbi:MAG: hypothetical protein LBQ45_02720 [Mycoplasmataceae bacterium]|jgi:hypothetical protein|nr:hypothetical protein [Mycoplasmataceae bacterium]